MKPRSVLGFILGPNNRELFYGIGCSVQGLHDFARRHSRYKLPRVKKLPGAGVHGFVWTPGEQTNCSVALLWVDVLRRKDETRILDYTAFLNTLVHEVTHAGQILLPAAGLPLGSGEEHKEPLACFVADTVERILWEVER